MSFPGTTRTSVIASPVTYQQAHDYMRCDSHEQRDLISSLLLAATDAIERQTRKVMLPSTFTLTLDAFPADRCLELWPLPLLSVQSVKYDADGQEQTMPAGDYHVDASNRPGRIVLKSASSWPTTNGEPGCIRVSFTAGHATAEDVPAGLKQALKSLVALWFLNSEAATDKVLHEVPMGVQRILDLHTFRRAV